MPHSEWGSVGTHTWQRRPDMRILILGGSGFIGRHLVPQLLDAGHAVGIVQRPHSEVEIPEGAEPLRADRRDLREHARDLRAFAPDIVVDLILSSGRQATELVDLFAGYAARLVAITSADVYRAASVLHGFDTGPLEPMPLTEESALRATADTYPPAQIAILKGVFGWLDDAYDKVAVEKALRGNEGLATTILRLPMIYGPGDRLHRLYPIVKRVDDQRPAILIGASVAAWRGPRSYVENVAAAIALAATSSRAAGRTYNVAEHPSFTELEWTQLVAREAGFRGEIKVLPDDITPAHLRLLGRTDQHWVLDSTRIRSELGYRESVPLSEALRRTIEWERANPPETPLVAFNYPAEDAVLATR
jgi:nucleoside-diphosphate-sugar epimerase